MARGNGAVEKLRETLLALIAPGGAQRRAEEKVVRGSPVAERLSAFLRHRRKQREERTRLARAGEAQARIYREKGRGARTL